MKELSIIMPALNDCAVSGALFAIFFMIPVVSLTVSTSITRFFSAQDRVAT